MMQKMQEQEATFDSKHDPQDRLVLASLSVTTRVRALKRRVMWLIGLCATV
ncbi:hypothetical protein V6259_07875 [Marinomonas sp. TI.3.20]|uniref:hypothetical protein n=1 Tax=Marinomonas sp. TI.3.20 TaxID=3121296 RepID=UPI00311F4B91